MTIPNLAIRLTDSYKKTLYKKESVESFVYLAGGSGKPKYK